MLPDTPLVLFARSVYGGILETLASRVTGSHARAGGSSEVQPGKRFFSSDWVANNVPAWEEILAPYRGRPNAQYLEIGVFEGRSLFWMLENIFTHPTARATAVDPLYPYYALKLGWNLANSPSSSRLRLIPRRSKEALPALLSGSFDVIYVDGSHVGKDVSFDLESSWRLLKPGGTLILDDYLWKVDEGTEDRRPGPAIDAFLTRFASELEIVNKAYQVIVRKSYT